MVQDFGILLINLHDSSFVFRRIFDATAVKSHATLIDLKNKNTYK